MRLRVGGNNVITIFIHLFLIIHSKPGLCVIRLLFLYDFHISFSCYKALPNLIHSKNIKSWYSNLARYCLDFTFCSLSNRWSILKNECATTASAVRVFCLVLTPKSISHCFQALYRCSHIIIILDHEEFTRCPTCGQGS